MLTQSWFIEAVSKIIVELREESELTPLVLRKRVVDARLLRHRHLWVP